MSLGAEVPYVRKGGPGAAPSLAPARASRRYGVISTDVLPMPLRPSAPIACTVIVNG
jgi:hypothetical protein